MLYGGFLGEIEHGFTDCCFSWILFIFSSSSLFSFISEWTVIKTVRNTWPRSNGKYVQLLLLGVPQKKMNVRENGAGGLFIRIHKLQNCNVPQMTDPCSPVALISGTLKPEGDAPYIPKLSHTVYSPGLISPSSLTNTQLSNFIQVLFVKYGNFLRVRHCCDKLKSLSMIWH